MLDTTVPWWLRILAAPFIALGLLVVHLTRALIQAARIAFQDVRRR